MNVSLDQAIEIHAKVLRYRVGERAAEIAVERARLCEYHGDPEGSEVWLRVKAVIIVLESREDTLH